MHKKKNEENKTKERREERKLGNKRRVMVFIECANLMIDDENSIFTIKESGGAKLQLKIQLHNSKIYAVASVESGRLTAWEC